MKWSFRPFMCHYRPLLPITVYYHTSYYIKTSDVSFTIMMLHTIMTDDIRYGVMKQSRVLHSLFSLSNSVCVHSIGSSLFVLFAATTVQTKKQCANMAICVCLIHEKNQIAPHYNYIVSMRLNCFVNRLERSVCRRRRRKQSDPLPQAKSTDTQWERVKERETERFRLYLVITIN